MSHLSLRVQLFVASLALALLVPVVASAGSLFDITIPRWPGVGNGHKATNWSTWAAWCRHRLVLGKAQTDELYVKATAQGLNTEGTAIRFRNGIILRNNTAPRKGETSTVAGGIFVKYEELAGVHGRLGFPTGDSYIHDVKRNTRAQNFERGQIYWSLLADGYVVRYFGE